MANPSTPFRASRNAPQRKVHRYIEALFTDDHGRQSKLTITSANSFARKKLDTAAQSLQLRTERQEKKARRVEIREWRAAERSVAAELREADHRARLLSRTMRTKVRPEKKVRHTPPKERRRDWPYAAVALPKYDGPVFDRRGERGVFMRMRYYSRRTAEAGVSQRVVLYCFNGAELDPDGNPYVATNVGATIDEALCGFDHLEQVNWSAAKNAKLLMHGILAVDHRQTPDEMMTCGVRWAEETLGRFDLPYLVTLHAPPPDGDQRNWHLHVLWSFRPLVHTDDHEWQVGEMLRTDLDNPAAMKLFREMFAAVMTDVSFEAGQNQVWAAKSNADRGLPHEPQVHLGGARTNQARSGEHVPANEENHERVMRSKAAVIDDTLRHGDEALAKLQDAARAIASRFARLPALPMRVPERVVAAALALDGPQVGEVPMMATVDAIAPPAVPPMRVEAARTAGPIEHRASAPPRPAAVKSVTAGVIPALAQRPARLDIADLRIRPLPVTGTSIDTPKPLPARRVEACQITVPVLPVIVAPRLARIGPSVLPRSVPVRSFVNQLPALAPWPTAPTIVALDPIDDLIARVRDVQKRDDERRKREEEAAALAAREAAAARTRLAAEVHQLEAAAAVTKTKARSSGWHKARALRQRAMAEWNDAEAVRPRRMPQPGRQLPQPGADRPADAARPVRRFPFVPGPGLGD